MYPWKNVLLTVGVLSLVAAVFLGLLLAVAVLVWLGG